MTFSTSSPSMRSARAAIGALSLTCTLTLGCGDTGLVQARVQDRPVERTARVLLEFTGTVDVLARTLTLRPLDRDREGVATRALSELPVGSGGTVGTVELANEAAPTTVVDGCGSGVNSFEGGVYIHSFFTEALSDVFVEITSMTPGTGNEGCLDAPDQLGLSSTLGLFSYGDIPSEGNALATWRFRNVSGTNFTFVGRVMGDVSACFVDDDAPTCDDAGDGTRTAPFCTITAALAHPSVFPVVNVAAGSYGSLTIDRAVRITGGLTSGFLPGGGATTVVSTTNNVPAVAIGATGDATLEDLNIENNTVTGDFGFVDGVFVASGGNLVLRRSTVRGGTSGASPDTNGVRVAGTALLESCTVHGGTNTGTGGEDNAAALHVVNGGEGTARDSDLLGGISARGFSYGVLNHGTALLERNTIHGGTATNGLFTLGIRNKPDAAGLKATGNFIHGGSNFQNTYGIWSSQTLVVVGNTIDGGSPVPTGTPCARTTPCGANAVCQADTPAGSTGVCASGRTTAVQLDGGTASFVNNVMAGGGGSLTGFACDIDADCGSVGFCSGTGGECIAFAAAVHLQLSGDGIQLTTHNNVVTDGFTSFTTGDGFEQVAVFGPGQIADAQAELNDCVEGYCVASSNNLAVSASTDHAIAVAAGLGVGVDPTTVLGTELDGLDFLHDIDNDARPIDLWDSGADER